MESTSGTLLSGLGARSTRPFRGDGDAAASFAISRSAAANGRGADFADDSREAKSSKCAGQISADSNRHVRSWRALPMPQFIDAVGMNETFSRHSMVCTRVLDGWKVLGMGFAQVLKKVETGSRYFQFRHETTMDIMAEFFIVEAAALGMEGS